MNTNNMNPDPGSQQWQGAPAAPQNPPPAPGQPPQPWQPQQPGQPGQPPQPWQPQQPGQPPQPGQPWQPQQQWDPNAAAPPKKKRFPIWIPIVAVVLIGAIVAGYFLLGGLKNVDNYELEGLRIKSVTSVVGDRKITGKESGVTNAGKFQKYTYKSDDSVADITAYFLDYLVDSEKFLLLTDFSSEQTSGTIEVGKNADTEGFIYLVKAKYDKDGYEITVSYDKGEVTPLDTDTDSDTDTDTDTGPDFDPIPPGDPEFVTMLKSNSYGFACEILFEAGGESLGGTGYYTRKDDMFAYQWGTGLFIFKNGLMYYCDTYEMTYFTEPSDMDDVASFFEIMQRSGDGSAELYGETLSYVEYSGGGMNMRFYLKDGDVHAFQYTEVEDGVTYKATIYVTEVYSTYLGDLFDHSRYTEIPHP